ISPQQRTRALGLPDRPLGPGRWENVTTGEVYRAIVEQQPYPVRGLVGFGANLLLSHADARRGRAALSALDFYVHADLFMTPTAALADVVLPVATPFEREALKIGFEVSPSAQSLVQLRRPVVEPRGEARSDTEHGYSPLPEYEEPLIGPRSRPDLVERYPLVLTCAKHTQFCQSQHRGLPSLRRRALDPEVDLHPADATDRGLRAGDWAIIETPE